MHSTQSNVYPDLDSRQELERFVRRFYGAMLEDATLGPLFIDVAAVDLDQHMPHIVDYWAKLLLGEPDYNRHTMNIHRRLHSKRALQPEDFQRWLGYFHSAVDSGWRGPRAERAKRIASTIAQNMQTALSDS
ncbi:MAG: group III truncated hemoglobin [Halieaceae bacterium]|jgi:hemoglobin|nr:group III truncated hemoglobin [Halieaceae bacterium]